MSSYVYELPTTGSVVFSDILSDETGKYTHPIANATLARSNLRAALKEAKRTDEGGADHLRIVTVVEEYLPHLYAIVECLASGDLQLRQPVNFSWRSTFSANLLNNSPRQSVVGIFADLAFALITYASALSNLAATTVTALGTYETERAITDTERKAKDDKLNFAVQLLKRASGVFSHVAESVIPQWERSLLESGGDAQPSAVNVRPVDLSRELVSALSKFALAEAQTLATRKLLSKSAYDSTLNPGPPLPRSHPPPGLVAKLSLNALDGYSSARSLAKSARGGNGSGEVTKDLTRWLTDEAALTSALSHKWLGVDAGEKSSTTGKAGEAVGFLSWAKEELDGLKDGGHGIVGLGRKKKRKERVAEEISSTSAFLNHYKKLNNTVHFESVPPVGTLQSMIPAGAAAVTGVPYTPPTPAFHAAKPAASGRPSETAQSATENEVEPIPQSGPAPSSNATPRQYF